MLDDQSLPPVSDILCSPDLGPWKLQVRVAESLGFQGTVSSDFSRSFHAGSNLDIVSIFTLRVKCAYVPPDLLILLGISQTQN